MWGAASFLFSPAGKTLALVLAVLAWTAYSRHDATKDCQEAQLAAELKESQRQLVIANRIAEEARTRADQMATEIVELKDLADDIVQNPGSSCSLDDGDVERLLRIR